MYHYTESGLDNVYLLNGYEEEDTPYGRMVSFYNIDGLHKALGDWLVKLPKTLNGAELRFLRHELDLSQKRLASLLGVSEVTVRRWEAKKSNPIGATADRLVRVFYLELRDSGMGARELAEWLVESDQ